jgi:hypothetical protein
MNTKVKALLNIAGTCGKGILTMAIVGANVMSLKKCITKSAKTLEGYDNDITNDIATLMGKTTTESPIDVDIDIDG